VRIYVFTEHFPNTYKPYFDTQFADFIDQGHQVSVFAFGKFDASLNVRTARYRLHERTRYVPFTLRSLPRMAPRAVIAAATRPRRPAAAWEHGRPAKRNLLDAARAAMLPSEEPDLCLIHNLVAAQYFGFLGRIYPSARVALYFHGGEVPQGGVIGEQETRSAFERAHRVFTNTAYARDLAIDRGCPPAKIAVCPVGFSLEDYLPPATKQYRREGVLRLLSVGRVSEEKGLHHAVEAVRLLVARRRGAGLRYRIVGRGTYFDRLKAAIAAAGLGTHVELCGELPNHAVLDEYRAADALLLPSIPAEHWEENQACVAQEAMLMKLPVLSTRTGGVQESIAPELRPLAVAPADPSALADRIEMLLDADDVWLTTLGEVARVFAWSHYGIRQLNDELLAECMRDRTGSGEDLHSTSVAAAASTSVVH
jgi:colanic acid/amylovoran biosynthesis glycosyltransferase